jgi:hypothetical protein
MNPPCPDFRWPRFLVAFIAAPLLITLLTFWLYIPIYALIFGGPLYLIAGLPIAAWYLQRHNNGWVQLILLALICQLLQIPIFFGIAWTSGDWNMLQALSTFLVFGAIFAVLWTGTFLILYALLARAEMSAPQKEQNDV